MRKLLLGKKLLMGMLMFLIFGVQQTQAEIKMLYNTDFTDWTAFSASAVGTTNTVTKTTGFTNESLTFTFSEILCSPTGTNTKFAAPATTGYIMCAKTGTTYFTTSALASITKIFIVEAATGSGRGFVIWKKGTTDADWVQVYNAAANPAGGDSTTIAIPGDQTNVQLKFTNLAAAQNAYLTDFQIFGNYNSSKPQDTLYTSMNIPAAGKITRSPNSSTFDRGTAVKLKASYNFGYRFDNWTDSVSGSVLSTADSLIVTLNGSRHIRAVYHAIDTYELSLGATGGAASYMISPTPSPTMISGKMMYETGTVVTLTANVNPIFTFTNWATGEGSPIKVVTMNQNQTVVAAYSATDYIVGWDFYKSGGSSRPADFYSSTDNQSSTLILRKADGTLNSWLDKSIVAAAGYYDRGAAVNWKPVADQYYYQIGFDATNYTDISVTAGLLYNYNAYAIQRCEYSVDGTNFSLLGNDTLTAGQTWFDKRFTLPSTADHASKVYVRWIPDYSSSLVGATAVGTDGTSLSNVYVFAKTAVYNDGVAPVLTGTVPAVNATSASASGKIVLNFDEKIQVVSGTTATLGTKSIAAQVSGMSLTFSYLGLEYNTQYTFTLPGNTVSDLAGNTKTDPITFTFRTMNRPVVTKKLFDFVVGVDGDFKAAITAATAASSNGDRFRIFFPNGNYNIGASTGDANQKSVLTLPNVSYVGQSADGVVLYNQNTTEGIGTTATINFTSTANNLYLQDLSLKNKDYRSGTTSLGRCVALQDQGTKNIYKNVNVLSNQDTYYSGSGRLYFEGGSLHGTVDFLCGGGDVVFNECLLYLEDRSGNCITAPATNSSWGYVFLGCTIDGFPSTNGNYNLGRPWQNSPRAVYINTTMNVLSTASGWTEMGVVPGLFAEYNTRTSTGAVIDLSTRKKTYTYNSVTTTAPNPVLTTTEAEQYTIDNILSGTDTWQPRLYTEQAVAPTISGTGADITWDDNNYVLCWAIFKDGVFVKFVTTNSYTIPSSVSSGSYTVRAANEMGGLSAVSNAFNYSALTSVDNASAKKEVVHQSYFTPDGRQVYSLKTYTGTILIRTVYTDGSVETRKIVKTMY